MQPSSDKVSEYWSVDRRPARPISWLQHPVLMAHVNTRITGDPRIGAYRSWQERFLKPPVELGLSLSCGFGGFERSFVQLGSVKRFHAMDLAQGAIEAARREAYTHGMGDRIEYSVVDLNQLELPPNTYDAIFAIQSAHHIYTLENYFKQCKSALKPDALLFLDEYIGPSYLQCPPEVVSIINRIRDLLPQHYRRSAFNNFEPITQYNNSPIEHFEKHDPSEAIRSSEILNVLKYHFDIVEVRNYGGAILHMLLSGLAGNFDETNLTDVTLLKLIALLEELLENAGAIQSDHAAIVARPKQ